MAKLDKKLFWWIFGVTKGGPIRARIIELLKERPYNANQLAHKLHMDYTTIRYHLDILVKHGIVESSEETYVVFYYLSEEMEQAYPDFEEINKKIGRDEG
jgi:DNA-binding transcriptional ArsR family regulator